MESPFASERQSFLRVSIFDVLAKTRGAHDDWTGCAEGGFQRGKIFVAIELSKAK